MLYWKLFILGITLITNTSFCFPQVIDKIIAIVNNDIILESDIDNFMQPIKFNVNKKNLQLSFENYMRQQIIDRLIMYQILLQVGKNKDIKISNEKVDKVITFVLKQNQTTLEKVKTYLKRNDIMYSTYFNQIKKEILISEILKKEVENQILIAPEELKNLELKIRSNLTNYNSELNMIHIMIPLSKERNPNEKNQETNQIKNIIFEAKKGKDLIELALDFSRKEKRILKIEKINSDKNKELLPKEVLYELRNTKKNSLLGPIQSDSGIHIIKVEKSNKNNIQNMLNSEIHIRHILLKSSSMIQDNQAKEKLNLISSYIRSGKISFFNAAKLFSQDLISANLGGDLGWTVLNACNHNFKTVLMNLKKGQISSLVRSDLGWHLIELIDIRPLNKTDEHIKHITYQILFNQKFSLAAENWMKEQHDRAYIKILSNR